MTREETKKLLPIITAYAEGKEIELEDSNGNWHNTSNLSFCRPPECYRIKPVSEYRPFKNAEECWKEIQKHECFGWVRFKNRTEDGYIHIEAVRNNGTFFSSLHIGFEDAFEYYTFIDGSPFGRKKG